MMWALVSISYKAMILAPLKSWRRNLPNGPENADEGDD